MKRIIWILVSLLTVGCMAPIKYSKPSGLVPEQFEQDQNYCNMESMDARDMYFPQNPMLNWQARHQKFDYCMKSKGYTQG